MIDQILYAMLDTTRIPVVVHDIADPYTVPYGLPRPQIAVSPEQSRMIAELQAWTHWSNRTVAQVIGTTHPTVKAIRDGRLVVGHRNAHYPQRLKAVHQLTARVFLLAGRDPRRAKSLLEDHSGGESPRDYLSRGDIYGANRALFDVLRTSRPTALIPNWRPLSPRNRTVDPSDRE